MKVGQGWTDGVGNDKSRHFQGDFRPDVKFKRKQGWWTILKIKQRPRTSGSIACNFFYYKTLSSIIDSASPTRARVKWWSRNKSQLSRSFQNTGNAPACQRNFVTRTVRQIPSGNIIYFYADIHSGLLQSRWIKIPQHHEKSAPGQKKSCIQALILFHGGHMLLNLLAPIVINIVHRPTICIKTW